MLIIIEIVALLIIISAACIGVPIAIKRFLSMDPKRKELEAATKLDEQGEVNAVKFTLDQLRYCAVCQQPTNPKTDLRLSAAWIHHTCYLDRYFKDKKGNA